jgi:hypothetical protein
MRKLLIKIFDSEKHNLIETVICEHLDATERETILHRYSIPGIPSLANPVSEIYCIPAKIKSWNIIEGLITIYYQTGFEMEISRIIQV